MKTKIITGVAALSLFAGVVLCQAGNVEKGKLLFESPAFGGGTSGKSCNSCHAGGNKLSRKLFDEKTKAFWIMGMQKKSLAEVINICIEKPLAGKAIDPEGEEMMDLIAYMETLVK
jgi:cytochrome c